MNDTDFDLEQYVETNITFDNEAEAPLVTDEAVEFSLALQKKDYVVRLNYWERDNIARRYILLQGSNVQEFPNLRTYKLYLDMTKKVPKLYFKKGTGKTPKAWRDSLKKLFSDYKGSVVILEDK